MLVRLGWVRLGPKRTAGPKGPRILGPNRLCFRAEKVTGSKRPTSAIEHYFLCPRSEIYVW